jgi:zinc transport system substrate-binding protein
VRLHRARFAAIPALIAPLALAGCGSADGAGGDGVSVLASFYPLQYVAQEVGGERVSVENLTPPAAEPHDLELAPAQTRAISQADVVVYLSGFQPAVDQGVEARAPELLVDAADVVTLEAQPGSAGHADEPADEHAGEHAEQGDDGHDHGSVDPHFWLDPTRLGAVAHAVAGKLSAADPENAEQYAANARDLEDRMAALDTELAEGLASCKGATLVTSHTAFGYLAERYGLEQVGIVELDPEAEPSPARLREIGEVVRDHGVRTIYSETLVSPKVAQTLAADLGVGTATLDPLEGLADDAPANGSSEADYESVMRANLAALEEGLACS